MMIDVLSTQKYQYLDCSNTSEQEFYYIPKDNIFLGHPVDRLLTEQNPIHTLETER